MNQLWSITVDDYLEVVTRAKAAGLKPGDSMEAIFLEYMKEKGQASFARTEFTKEEILSELLEKNDSILDVTTDKEGKTKFQVINKKENEND